MSGLIVGAGKLPTATLLLLVGGLIIVVVAAGLVILKVRSALLAKQTRGAEEEGLLSGLRRMRDAGEITPQEYDATRKTMAARAAGKPRPIAAATVQPPSEESRARPGFDLTGAPLPKPPPDSGR